MRLKVDKRMSFGWAGLYFWDKFRGRLPLLGERSGLWGVRVVKKLVHAISNRKDTHKSFGSKFFIYNVFRNKTVLLIHHLKLDTKYLLL